MPDHFSPSRRRLGGLALAFALLAPGLVTPLARYAVGCIMPENNSTFRNLVNIAIARLLQSYLNDDPAAVAIVNRWFGPQGMLELPTPMIKAYFAAVMLNYEQIQVASPSSAK